MASLGARFTDIDLGNKRLPACFGYLNWKILPLRDAFNDLESTLPQINKFIGLARRHCTYPNSRDLTRDESATLYLYTMEMADDTCVYQILNKKLRHEDRSQVRPWFAYLKLFDTAAEKLSKFEGTVWRGVDKDLSKEFKKNQTITWWSISSCSKSIKVIKNFLGNTEKSTLFNIECKNGRCISEFTCYPNEDEVVLMPGTTLKVVDDALDHGGLVVMHLKEIDDDDMSDDEESGATASAQSIKTTGKKMSEMTLSKSFILFLI